MHENHQPFTDREKEIVAFVKQEYTDLMISKKLGISKRTVETHLKNIRLKGGVTSRVGVAALKID